MPQVQRYTLGLPITIRGSSMQRYTWLFTVEEAGEFIRKFANLGLAPFSDVSVEYKQMYKDNKRCIVTVDYKHDDEFFVLSLATGLLGHWGYNKDVVTWVKP